ncbi:MAG: protein kinase [Candidatus Aminicenantales bacterium]
MQAPVRELATGSIIAGRYQVIEELGRGGMGRVYKVFDTEIHEKIALKLLKPELAVDRETGERFRNELRLTRKIRHKNICQMFDLAKEGGNAFITMEYVQGEDLKRLIRKMGQMSAGQAVAVAKQVAEGLAEAHRQGIVHRDLKPQNIMVDEEGNARIMDFGIARSVKAKGLTGEGVMIGTPEYMSPEQVEGKEVDSRSDIYSLGIILYEMVTGRVPFEGETPFTIGVKHKSEIPKNPRQINNQIPEDLSQVILRCLEKDKEKRYPSSEALLDELKKIEKGLPTTERVIPKRKPLTAKEITVTFKMKKLLWPAAVVLALALAAIILWQVLPSKTPLKKSIAVINFANQTGDQAYDYLQAAIPNLLITSLEQSRYLRVTTWERMHDLLKQMGKGDVQAIDTELGFELCQKDGVEAIVLGSFVKAGDFFVTDVKVLDVASKKLLKSASSKGEGVRSILEKQIGDLSREISKGIGLSERKIETAQVRIAEFTTSSMEAYKYFLQARDAQEKLYDEEARDFAERAIQIDPNFAMAYLHLAFAQENLNNNKESREAIEKAKALAGRATDKERFYIEFFYARSVEQNREKALRLLQELTDKYPQEKLAHWMLGVSCQNRGQFDQAIAELQKALALDPGYHTSLNQLVYLYLDMGNYEKSLKYAKEYVAARPGDANPLDTLAEVCFRRGDLDQALAQYQAVIQMKPNFYNSYLALAYVTALQENYEEAKRWLDRFISISPSLNLKGQGYWNKNALQYWTGQYGQALSELLRLMDMAEATGFGPGKAITAWLLGWIYYNQGQLDLSRTYYQNWFEIYKKAYPNDIAFNTISGDYYLGLVDLKEGKVSAARAKLEEMKSFLEQVPAQSQRQTRFYYDLFQGEVFMAEASVEQAIAVLSKTPGPGRPPWMSGIFPSYNMPFIKDTLARAYVKKGQVEKAIAEYERLTSFDPKREERLLIYPKYHYWLAKLYEQKEFKDKAARQYRKFLEIWKAADPGLQEYQEAQTRLTALTKQ